MTCYELEQLLKKNNNFEDHVVEDIEPNEKEPFMDTSKVDQNYDWSEMKVVSN